MLLLTLVGAIFLGVLGVGLLRRILFRIALRNAWRHARSTALAIVGLMIGTAMISSAFAIGDSFKSANRAAIFDTMVGVDERVLLVSPSGERLPFNDSVGSALGALQGGAIEGVAPALVITVAVVDHTSQQGEARVNVIGLEGASEGPFGALAADGFDVDDIPQGGAAINDRLAVALGAGVGDALELFYRNPSPSGPPTLAVTLNVTEVLPEKPERIKANYLGGENLFLPLAQAQELFGLQGQINEVRVTNVGGFEDGIDSTDRVFPLLAAAVNASEIPRALIQTTKGEVVQSDINSDTFGQLFFIFSMFTVIAGVMLIFLIFVLLALERKPEMGMARAVGMTRGQLILAFLFEGTLYSLAASAIGAVAGIAISMAMLWAFGGIFIPEDPGALLRFLTVKPDSLALAFGIGFLITFLTILFASVRVSRLNIIRAIRSIPEPTHARASKRQAYLGIAIAAVGALVYAGSWGQSLSGVMAGPALVFLGAAPLLRRRLAPRASYSIAGALIVAWSLYPEDLPGSQGAGGNFDVFIVAGVLAVLGGVLVVIFNATPLLDMLNGLFATLRRSSAVLKISTTYAVASPFRTALVMAMVGLVVFTVTVVSVFGAIQFSNIDDLWQDQSGGYDVAGYATVPITNLSASSLPSAMANYSYDDLQIVTRGIGDVYRDVDQNGSIESGEAAVYPIIGLSDSLFQQARFSLFQRAPEYASDEAAWAAAAVNESLVIADRNVLPNYFGPPTNGPALRTGQEIVIAPRGAEPNSSAARHVKVIGVMNEQFFIQGIFVHQNLSTAEFFAQPVIVLLDAHTDGQANAVKLALESSYLNSGMEAIDTRAIIDEASRATLQVFVLIEVFMGLGLVVGIAGLGIVMLRNVRERRQHIGVLRAIGFQTRMVLNAFVIEASFISILGMAVGLTMGLVVAYELWDDFFRPTGALFIIAWEQLALIVGMTYVATTFSALGPALRASRMAPAEALRSVD